MLDSTFCVCHPIPVMISSCPLCPRKTLPSSVHCLYVHILYLCTSHSCYNRFLPNFIVPESLCQLKYTVSVYNVGILLIPTTCGMAFPLKSYLLCVHLYTSTWNNIQTPTYSATVYRGNTDSAYTIYTYVYPIVLLEQGWLYCTLMDS